MEEPARTNMPILNEHQFWVNLSALGEGNVFGALPRLIQEMLYADSSIGLSSDLGDLNIIFPSDPEWRNKIYLKLVEKQRLSAINSEMEGEEMADTLYSELPTKLHDWNIVPKKKPSLVICEPELLSISSKEVPTGPGPITWTVSDLAKAGCLLSVPPINTTFDDEHEMRRVYTLIYDVFRFKHVLNQALNDVTFFYLYPKLKKTASKVWLLLYDFYHRGFEKREVKVLELAEKLFDEADLTDIEEALCTHSIKLAAAVARLRIKKSALRLSDLLPRHLRNDRIANQNSDTPVTCWINIRKVKSTSEVRVAIQSTLNLKQVHDNNKLDQEKFKIDKLCPQFVVFHSTLRNKIAQSKLVKSSKLIMQDRSFCLGPATFGRLLTDLQLTGCVIQTHVNSPRTTAYLANLLSQNEKIKKLMAFSAGRRKEDYEKYFEELGVTNIVIYSDRLIDIPPESHYLEEVIAVFATPPNSYSAVTDPVDLVCSSGGDLSMLEILTESEESQEGRERVTKILEEQRKTLQFAMSRPQIQFVLYETHSELSAENEDMVKHTVTEMNKVAKLHHASLQGKFNIPQTTSSEDVLSETQEINNNEKVVNETVDSDDDFSSSSDRTVPPKPTEGIIVDENSLKDLVCFKDGVLQVPACDIFDIPALPDLCPNSDSCLKLSREGCYLSLMQRKQIIHFDNKFMIQIAESRGLFGNPSTTSGKSRSSRMSRKKSERVASPPARVRKRSKAVEMDRITAPTVSSIIRSKQSPSPEEHPCRRTEDSPVKKRAQPRRWWNETAQHLTALRASLIRQKIVPTIKHSSYVHGGAREFVQKVVNRTNKIDEIFAKSTKRSRIPVFPKLRLTRVNEKQSTKVQLPVAVTVVQFPHRRSVY